MGFERLIRKGIATANRITSSVQTYVDIEPWISQDSVTSLDTYDASIRIPAIVTMGPVPLRTPLGEIIEVRAIAFILQPVTSNGAAGRAEPIDPRDRVTLSDGTRGPAIKGADGLVDPSTGRPYFHTVGIGNG